MPLKHNLMTTLHGLVTISEFFAGFNLINTAVVNCLIMCQNASKMHNSEATNTKIFREGAGCAPSQTPLASPIGERGHPSPNLTPSAPRNSRQGARPPNESPGSASEWIEKSHSPLPICAYALMAEAGTLI